MKYLKLFAKLLAIVFIFMLVKPVNALLLGLISGSRELKETVVYEMNRSPNIKKAYLYVIEEFNKENTID